jgi:hypothetical protein
LKRRHELFAAGVVLHGRWVSLGIRQHLAVGIDNGGPSPGGQSFLSRDLCQRMASIYIHTVREQDCFLGKVALDLLAQRLFPGAANGKIQGDHGRCDHENKDREQLEKNSAPHFGTSNR